MLLLPYRTRFSVRALPLASLVLIGLMVVAHLGMQRDDPALRRAALQFYARSMLPAIESPRYEAWLRSRRDEDARARLRQLELDRAARPVEEIGGLTPSLSARLSTQDVAFTRELRAGRIVTPADPDYVRWRADRDQYELAAARVSSERLGLSDPRRPMQWFSHAFLHLDGGHLLATLLVLLVAGPLAEAALGPFRFLAGWLAAAALTGLAQQALFSGTVVGGDGAGAATVGMVAMLYRFRAVPVFYWIGVYGRARFPTLVAPAIWAAAACWLALTETPGLPPLAAVLVGLLVGATFARVVHPEPGTGPQDADSGETFGDGVTREGTLLADARAAAASMDIKRATRLYRELLAQQPRQTELVLAFFNVTMQGRDEDALREACVRLLRVKGRTSREEMRRACLQMSQPKVLSILAVDDQLRLVRRLVRVREDSAALRVLDRLLADERDVQSCGRQIADCLLALFMTYSRNGLRKQAQDVRTRLVRTFGGRPDLVAPKPPGTAQLRRALDETNTLNVPTR